MKYLFINTALTVSSVVLIEGNQITSQKEVQNANDLSSNIFFMIDNVFRDTNCTPQDLNKIFVVNGPGSFTGIRIGMSIAKTMAWALKIDLIPISSLELLASTSKEKNVIALIDARRDFVYAGGYDKNLANIWEDQYINIGTLLEETCKLNGCYISYDVFDRIKTDFPKIDYLNIILKHENDKVPDCHQINPIYLKLTEAEEKRNANKN